MSSPCSLQGIVRDGFGRLVIGDVIVGLNGKPVKKEADLFGALGVWLAGWVDWVGCVWLAGWEVSWVSWLSGEPAGEWVGCLVRLYVLAGR